MIAILYTDRLRAIKLLKLKKALYKSAFLLHQYGLSRPFRKSGSLHHG
jgi:hypothetical protein